MDSISRAWFLAFATLLTLGLGLPATAQLSMGGGTAPGWAAGPCLLDEQRRQILARLDRNIRVLEQRGLLGSEQAPEVVAFSWPLRSRIGDPGVHAISNFVDHLPASGSIRDYSCGTRTYDIPGYNHRGTDMIPWPFGFYQMERSQAEVVAAAAGVIVGKDDGNPDRSCDFSSPNWNAVYVRHSDGSVAWYGHLKRNSLTSKAIGASVVRGEYLGVVGSSGSSTGPHLHFEVYSPTNTLIDPYQGTCNSLNAASWWQSQRPYVDPGINKLATHYLPPEFPTCPRTERPSFSDDFNAGQTVYYTAYFRDQVAGQSAQYRVRMPNGNIHQSWSHATDVFYWWSYWYWSLVLPAGAPSGTWRFEVDFNGQTYTKSFRVGSVVFTDGFESGTVARWH